MKRSPLLQPIVPEPSNGGIKIGRGNCILRKVHHMPRGTL